MDNRFFAPALREYLAKDDIKGLQGFCATGHPGMIADLLADLATQETWEVLRRIEPSLRTEIFSNFSVDVQIDMTRVLKRNDLASLIADMSPDDRVDLLKRIPEEQREALLPAIAQAEREDIRKLASYEEGTAGSVMTSDYATLRPDIPVGEALEKLRREAPDKETVYYCYVIDSGRKLIGFVSLKDLILAKPKTPVGEIMHRDLVFARVDDDQEDAANKIAKYDLIALPVVNGNNVLVGIITHDDAIDIIHQEHTEDMEKFMAIAGSHETGAYLQTSSWSHFRNRFGWLIILAALGLVSGYIVQNFEGLLMQFAILATFMPMLADTGGNTGSQSATLVVRALAIKEISHRDILRVMLKEFKVAVPMALLLAGLAFGRVILFSGNSNVPEGFSLAIVGIAVGAALGIQVVTATLIGAFLPLAAAKMRFDPAVVASPALTTIVDITGLLIYFTTAKLIFGL